MRDIQAYGAALADPGEAIPHEWTSMIWSAKNKATPERSIGARLVIHRLPRRAGSTVAFIRRQR